VNVRLEVGPIVRSSARHKGTFAVIVLQLASTFTIMASLSLVGTLFRRTGRLHPGYDEADLISVKVRAPVAQPDTLPAREQLHAIAALPGVAAVSPMWPGLRDESEAATGFFAVDASSPTSPTGPVVRGLVSYATPDLASVLGLRFIEGRAGAVGSPTGIILTRKLRDELFPGAPSALGRLVAAADTAPAEVVGVIENVYVREAFWTGSSHVGFHFGPSPEPRQGSFLVRARPGARGQVEAGLATLLGPSGPARLVTIVPLAAQPPRMRGVADGMVGVFGLLVLTVVAITLIGAVAVASFVVSERRRQIGIRRALGATRWDVFRYFLVESSLAAALGTGIGVVLTAALLLISRRVFPMLTLDWRNLAATAFLLWLTATAAALIPARRALRISPSIATRGR
jgi:putative ABC transport system permease protein